MENKNQFLSVSKLPACHHDQNHWIVSTLMGSYGSIQAVQGCVCVYKIRAHAKYKAFSEDLLNIHKLYGATSYVDMQNCLQQVIYETEMVDGVI